MTDPMEQVSKLFAEGWPRRDEPGVRLLLRGMLGTAKRLRDRENTLRLMTLRPYVHSRGEKVTMHWVDEGGFSDCGLHAEEWFIPNEGQRVCKVCEPDA